LEVSEAKEKLQKTLDPKRTYTVADAATASGLSLADADRGMHGLVAEYRGHLRVTEEGQIIFRFPTGFTRPWETQDAIARTARRVRDGVLGFGRFVVRAWVAIVLVAYVAIFVALLVGLAFAKSERSEGRGLSFAGPLLRLVFDALFWTMHPWSPFYVDIGEIRQNRRARRAIADEGKPPVYERVDRFFFGPRPERVDPDAPRRAVLAEIRAGKGRIGLADVMRVTGESRETVDPLMSKLLLDYGGSVEVSEEGGIAYRFPELRKTAADGWEPPGWSEPIWHKREFATPITGNSPADDLVIGGLNLFNLLASGFVLAQGLTVERIIALFQGVPAIDLPPPGLPIALGVVPFVFSLALFALPLGRVLLTPWREKRAAHENGRRAVLQAVLENAKQGVAERELVDRYRIAAAGLEPDPKELTKQVVALGGDVDLERAAEGVRYRFPDLELEARAVEAEREAASEEEARVGKVVFSSED
jgi:hypothetical protein